MLSRHNLASADEEQPLNELMACEHAVWTTYAAGYICVYRETLPKGLPIWDWQWDSR